MLHRILQSFYTKSDNRQARFQSKLFHDGLKVVSNLENSKIDIIFIHDVTQSREEAYDMIEGLLWPARTAVFGYDAANILTLKDLTDSDRLRKYANILLEACPLNIAEESANPTLENENIRGRRVVQQNSSLDIERPVIFVAHGFGGLIYEQALALAYSSLEFKGVKRRHAAILIDTPHHGAGVAEWAIICAKARGIPCKSTAQKQDWSSCEKSLNQIQSMQRQFRKIIREVIEINIAGCYAARPDPVNNLILAPEWAVLPDFKPFSIDGDHFTIADMTRQYLKFSAIINEWEAVLSKNGVAKIPKPPDRKGDLQALMRDERPDDTTTSGLVLLGIEAVYYLFSLYSKLNDLHTDPFLGLSEHKSTDPGVSNIVKSSNHLLTLLRRLKDVLNIPDNPNFRSRSIECDIEITTVVQGFRDCVLSLQDEIARFAPNITPPMRVYALQQTTLRSISRDLDNIHQQLSRLLDENGEFSSNFGVMADHPLLPHVSPFPDIQQDNPIDPQDAEIKVNENTALLLKAIQEQNTPWIEQLIEQGANTGPVHKSGRNAALYYAVENGHGQALESLLKGKFSPHARNKSRRTPLHLAAGNGKREAARLLLAAGAGIAAKDQDGWTPLHFAARNGHANMLDLLLRPPFGAKAHLIAQDKNGQTPLHIAIKSTHQPRRQHFLRELLAFVESGTDWEIMDHNGQTPLHLAASCECHIAVFDLVTKLTREMNGDLVGTTPLHLAAEHGDHITVQLLCQHGASTNSRNKYGLTPLHLASEHGQLAATRQLLKAHAKNDVPDLYSLTPLFRAAQNGYVEVINLLLEYGADEAMSSHSGFTLLHIASRNGHQQVVKFLLHRNADKEARDHLGHTPLFLGVQNMQTEIVELLIQNGAKVEINNNEGLSPLMVAARNDDSATLELLVKASLKDGNKDRYGNLLFSAVSEGLLDLMDVLVSNGVSTEVVDDAGFTPLHQAVINRRLSVVELLVQHGANTHTRDRLGRTPRDLAAARGSKKRSDVLLSYVLSDHYVREAGFSSHRERALRHETPTRCFLPLTRDINDFPQLDDMPVYYGHATDDL